MRSVVADTSPLFYLLAIDHIDILPELFGTVMIPDAVRRELCHPAAPELVREWVIALPVWAQISHGEPRGDPALRGLGSGERAAIELALSMCADLLLIDERKGTQAAIAKGVHVTGTLGILGAAARRGLVDLADSFKRLKRTNFRYRQEILDELLAEHSRDGGSLE